MKKTDPSLNLGKAGFCIWELLCLMEGTVGRENPFMISSARESLTTGKLLG